MARHVHIHMHPTRDSWEEGKHPRDGGKFSSKPGAGAANRETFGRIDAHQAAHAKATGHAIGRQQAAELVAKEAQARRSVPLREQVKFANKAKIKQAEEFIQAGSHERAASILSGLSGDHLSLVESAYVAKLRRSLKK